MTISEKDHQYVVYKVLTIRHWNRSLPEDYITCSCLVISCSLKIVQRYLTPYIYNSDCCYDEISFDKACNQSFQHTIILNCQTSLLS